MVVMPKGSSPRQPLSQRRPKQSASRKNVSAVKSSAALARGKKQVRPATAKKVLKKIAKKLSRPGVPADRIYKDLTTLYPNAHCELDFKNPYELLVATILSAQ